MQKNMGFYVCPVDYCRAVAASIKYVKYTLCIEFEVHVHQTLYCSTDLQIARSHKLPMGPDDPFDSPTASPVPKRKKAATASSGKMS